MKVNRIFGIGLMFSLLLTLGSCGPSVEVTGSWKNPDATPVENYSQLAVLGMVSNEQTKRAMEDALQNQLQSAGVEASKGYEMFPAMFTDRFENDKDQMLRKVQDAGSEGILSVSFLDKETETRYVPGTTGGYRPMATYGWYGNFWGYYDYYYPMVYDRGYYTTTKIYYIEANLYDAESGKLVWSGQTQTYDPAELDEFTENFAEAIVGQLRDEDILAGDG